MNTTLLIAIGAGVAFVTLAVLVCALLVKPLSSAVERMFREP